MGNALKRRDSQTKWETTGARPEHSSSLRGTKRCSYDTWKVSTSNSCTEGCQRSPTPRHSFSSSQRLRLSTRKFPIFSSKPKQITLGKGRSRTSVLMQRKSSRHRLWSIRCSARTSRAGFSRMCLPSWRYRARKLPRRTQAMKLETWYQRWKNCAPRSRKWKGSEDYL